MSEFDKLLNLKESKEIIEKIISEETATIKEKIAKLQAEMKEIEAPNKEKMNEIDISISEIKDNFLYGWSEPAHGKQFTDEDTGVKLTRKFREKPLIHNEPALLTQVVDFDKIPITKINWKNSELKTLITAGVIKPETATLVGNYELAITYPKSEVTND